VVYVAGSADAAHRVSVLAKRFRGSAPVRLSISWGPDPRPLSMWNDEPGARERGRKGPGCEE
jgi:hypothetical protein